MDNKYLWDRSGDPDPEIQELEEVLGKLRYQRPPLEIPANFQISRRRSLYPPLAIAATLFLFAVAIAIWVNLNRRPAMVAQPVRRTEQEIAPQPKTAAPDALTATIQEPPGRTGSPKRQRTQMRSVVAQNRSRAKGIDQLELTADELAQKEQVLFALRLASAKLNLAQRKTLGVPQSNIIRNQHKIG